MIPFGLADVKCNKKAKCAILSCGAQKKIKASNLSFYFLFKVEKFL